MDGTPLSYHMPMGPSVARKGQKSVPIKTTGHEKDKKYNFTIVLACLVDGTKFLHL